ncbi:MAG TPA: hypothetical protein VKV73_13015 [Chloroflexota bacterium]|nr:hypothetical protein [Chloroflexota bacterium]
MTSGIVTAAAEGRRSRTDRTEPGRAALEHAIVQAVAYADVFDYPLTVDEIHRYLIGFAASRAAVRAALATPRLVPDILSRSGRYITLAGRESAVDTRRRRAAVAAEYWQRAVRYGHLIGNLPFVRMVAVTGALAMDNIADGDIDYLVITEPGRLWLCRALVVGLVRSAAFRGTELCPNYFLSEQALVLSERNLFTAHEVAQMVPLSGIETYQRLRSLNQWTSTYLPNAGGPPRRIAPVNARPGRVHRILEQTLRSRICSPFERWEMARKMRKLGARGNGHAEAAFGPDWCKGHFGDHGQLTLNRYEQRMHVIDGILTGAESAK